MSDASNQDPDFRGNRETKRRDETVMIGQDTLGSMVDEARAAATSSPAPDDDASSGTRLIVLATGAIVILLVVIALVYTLVS